jgi:subtilisin family serine protease
VNARWDWLAGEKLTRPSIAGEATGRGITVAIVDSGVNFDHPHLAVRGTGASVEWNDGELEVREGVHPDLYGHGTCCAALIHALAPEAALFAVKVTGERATTDADRLAEGIRTAAEKGAAVVAVPMGTMTRLRARLDDVVAEVSDNSVIVAAWPHAGVLPAECAGALAAAQRDGVDVLLEGDRAYAEGLARPAPGFQKNFFGPSLATARVAAALARWAEISGDRGKDLLRGFKKTLLSG